MIRKQKKGAKFFQWSEIVVTDPLKTDRQTLLVCLRLLLLILADVAIVQRLCLKISRNFQTQLFASTHGIIKVLDQILWHSLFALNWLHKALASQYFHQCHDCQHGEGLSIHSSRLTKHVEHINSWVEPMRMNNWTELNLRFRLSLLGPVTHSYCLFCGPKKNNNTWQHQQHLPKPNNYHRPSTPVLREAFHFLLQLMVLKTNEAQIFEGKVTMQHLQPLPRKSLRLQRHD